LEHLSFLGLVQDDLKRVEAVLREQPLDQHEAINSAVDYLIGSGGKRLRPALVLLSSALCNADKERAIYAAAGVEMLHTATLVHDDLIDGALMRRGRGTLNARWTPGATVLTGDYLFARAASLVAQADSTRLTRRFAETLMIICNGEIAQMFDTPARTVTRQQYERRIYAKTASLIALSTQAGPILAQADEAINQALLAYGEQVGLAFQIVDDVLDFVADEETLGKPIGSDLRQGLVTLPTLLFLEAEPDHPLLRQVLADAAPDDALRQAVQLIAASPAVQQALAIAGDYCHQAIQALRDFPASPYKEALVELAEFTACRRF